MKLFTWIAAGLCLFLLTPVAGFAQGDDGFDIDNLFLDPHYFDNMEDANAKPDEVWYLDQSMQSPKLTQIPEGAYGFKNLKLLNVSFNRLASIDDGIGHLENLEILNAEGNHYLKSVSAEIGKLKKLKEFNIKNHGLSPGQIEEIKALLPEGCKFTH